MRRYVVLFCLAITMIGASSFAETHPPGWTCPLKNLKKSQRRGPDGTAFIPGKTVQYAKKAAAPKAVYIGQ